MIDKKEERGMSRAERKSTSDEPLVPKLEKLYCSTLSQAHKKKR